MYQTIAIGGTFDRLHKGHRGFIRQAFALGSKVIIGLTSDQYVERKCKMQNATGAKNTPGAARRDSSRGFIPRDSPGVKESEGIYPKLKTQNYQTRKKELEGFLVAERLLDRTEIVEIDDLYGPAVEVNQIEALLVTSETIEGARLINKKRGQKGLPPLVVHTIPLVLAEDKKRITSTRIRMGEIDREGRSFLRSKRESAKNTPGAAPPLAGDSPGVKESESQKFKRGCISEDLRQILKKPQGRLLPGDPENHQQIANQLVKVIYELNPVMIITVGDEVTKLCNQVGLLPNLAIVDFKVRRVKKYHSLSELGFAINQEKDKKTPQGWAKHSPGVKGSVTQVRNPAGHISKTLVNVVKLAIHRTLKRKYITNTGVRLHRLYDKRECLVVKVIGEEDLAGVPAILLSPLGTVVLYGQPQEGIVVVKVTEEKKRQLLQLLDRYC